MSSSEDRVQALSDDAALEAFLRQYLEPGIEPLRPTSFLSHLRPRRRPANALSVTYLRDIKRKPQQHERRPDHVRRP